MARSVTKTSLEMVFPKAMGNSALLLRKASLVSIVFIETTCGFALGTSIPMVPLPGIGAMIRMPRAESDKAMSSSRLLIFEMRIPGAGFIS